MATAEQELGCKKTDFNAIMSDNAMECCVHNDEDVHLTAGCARGIAPHEAVWGQSGEHFEAGGLMRVFRGIKEGSLTRRT
ncbi:hypothetical protein COCSUDRAFT_53461 [Coccomyxa subellipsoidea C-169]|uniref:Uncharacterized protein n=1 Tax=Coccomyxa subellipsoidea (strain C-169) TaxID=574566 RepID=I0YZH2_COCSC|nr:hypothetical protein COCSUDRAFT_53461 [Coccomyxa subellipsoidea C-169]EIE23791.1 hypothetical protein COCSUDRAFT_53461 [Coccomyxa subellipsoidea C-169]|eukprot:XP_005648335.1 hypothetical protein COCSUDRAFT_53461 [Coccomyxa subellipsoidea C-169]